MDSPTGRAANERASTLLLMPTAMLIMLMLSAIAVDFSHVFMLQRNAQRTAELAADDAAGIIDTERFRSSGDIAIDTDTARRLVLARLGASESARFLNTTPRVAVDGTTVTVTVDLRIEHPIGAIVPGGVPPTRTTLTAVARVEQR